MRFLFGDGTPFPCEQDFLATLTAATTTAAALFRVDALIEQGEREAGRAEDDARQTLGALDALGRSLGEALAPAGPLGGVTEALQADVAERLGEARREVERRRQVIAREHEAVQPGATALAVLERFVQHHDLPGTSWRLAWEQAGDDAPIAELFGLAPGGLELATGVALPTDHPLGGPLAIADLVSHLRLRLPRRGRFGRLRPREVALERGRVAELEWSPTVVRLGLRERRRGGVTVELVIPTGAGAPTARTFDRRRVEDAELALGGAEATAARALALRLDGLARELLAHRGRLRSARLGSVALLELARPAVLARCLLAALGPLTLELRRRSPVPGELTLKRELASGLREERFVPLAWFWREQADLSLEHRRWFERSGLGLDPPEPRRPPALPAPREPEWGRSQPATAESGRCEAGPATVLY